MKTLNLKNGCVAKISDEDFERVARFTWSASWNSKARWYAQRKERTPEGKRRTIYLHRFILELGPEEEVTFRDQDGLNVQRENMIARPMRRRRGRKTAESI